MLRQWGHDSRIFAEHIQEKMRPYAKSYTKLKGRHLRNALLIYHFSVGSKVSEFVRSLPNPKILIYHNITPGDFYNGYEPYIQDILNRGRDELKLFVNLCDLALGDSEFNRLELEEAGFQPTGVLPIILNFDKYIMPPDPAILTRYHGDGYKNILFVGRIAPNKKQEDVIHAFSLYKRYVNPRSRLFLVGMAGLERYDWMLDEFVRQLAVEDVHFAGVVSDAELLAYYHIADVLLCMSEHEGFCVPLVEAMHFEIPILAYHSSSIPYTLDDSGVLFHEKRYDELVEMLDLLLEDQNLRKRIIQAQQQRLEFFQKPRLEQVLKTYIEQVTRNV